jgi:hypothetical protein
MKRSTPDTRRAKPVAERLQVARDIEQRLAQFSPTVLDFDETLLRSNERKVLVKLVQAAQIIDGIFLDQVSADNRRLRKQLVVQKAPQALLDYFDVMYGPWDRLAAHAPFLGTQRKPLGAGYYPSDLSKTEFESWIKGHPQDEKAFRSYFTVIARQGQALKAVPYSQVYGARLKAAAALLEQASGLTEHAALKRYLSLRAKAFLTNDYFQSDMAWMDLGDSPLEVVIGPYEVYEDRLMGYKAAFEAFITIPHPVYSARLQKLSRYNQEVERNLPLPQKFMTKRGTSSPISVVDEIFTAGDTRSGVQTAAFNLPNDERVRAVKGSKKVMLKNVTEAKFNKVLIPIAQHILEPKLLSDVVFDSYFTDILLHEIAHGMGPGEITVGGRQSSVNKELKELYSALEECKADIAGLVNGLYLIKRGALPKTMRKQLAPTYVAGTFRAARFGAEAAHARAVLIGFNFLRENGAITYNRQTKRYGVDYRKFERGVRALAKILLLIQARGDYAGAKALLQRYGHVSAEMKGLLDTLNGIPVDIRPSYAILDKMTGW